MSDRERDRVALTMQNACVNACARREKELSQMSGVGFDPNRKARAQACLEFARADAAALSDALAREIPAISAELVAARARRRREEEVAAIAPPPLSYSRFACVVAGMTALRTAPLCANLITAAPA